MIRLAFRCVCLGLLTASTLGAGAALAQRDAGSPGAAVDPSVVGLDPLAASMRRVEPGNAQHSFAARLRVADFGRAWSSADPNRGIATDPATGLAHSQSYEYRSPGLRALLDRPQVVSDGSVRGMLIPANTVFLLTHERPRPAEPDAPPPPHFRYRDMRLNHHWVQADAQGISRPNAQRRQMRFPAAALQNHSTLPQLTPLVIDDDHRPAGLDRSGTTPAVPATPELD